jgi:hypothetical protein
MRVNEVGGASEADAVDGDIVAVLMVIDKSSGEIAIPTAEARDTGVELTLEAAAVAKFTTAVKSQCQLVCNGEYGHIGGGDMEHGVSRTTLRVSSDVSRDANGVSVGRVGQC